MEDVIIVGALAAILYLGVKMQRIAARRDVGQPWALDRSAVADTGTDDASAAVLEAEQIVRAARHAR